MLVPQLRKRPGQSLVPYYCEVKVAKHMNNKTTNSQLQGRLRPNQAKLPVSF